MRCLLIVCVAGLALSGSAAAATPFATGVVDSVGDVGFYSSLAIDDHGNPHISYWDYFDADLKYATRVAGAWTIETVDSISFTGLYSSLALDAQGSPHICYRDQSTSALMHARLESGAWVTEVVDSIGDTGLYPSLAIDSHGYPHVAYFDNSDLALFYAVRGDSFWTIETVDWLDDVGRHPSLALDAADLPHISYLDGANVGLRYAVKYAFGWWPEAVTTGVDVDDQTSLALDPRGIPRISFYNETDDHLMYASRETGSWAFETVDNTGNTGLYNSLALDPGGNAHIAYYDYTSRSLKYAARRGGSWALETVDTEGNVGAYASLALDPQGNPAVSYYDDWNTNLKYAASGIELVSPEGGETWPVGAERTIRWLGAGPVDVLLSADGGSSYELLAESIDRNQTLVRVPHLPTRFGRIQVRRAEPFSTSESDSFLTIEADIALLSLRAELLAGGGARLDWQSDPGPEDLAGYRLERAAGSTWQTLVGLTTETSYIDHAGAAGSRYRLFGVNGLGEAILLGETTIAPRTALSAWPLPYQGGPLNISFATFGGLGGGEGQTEVTLFNLAGRKIRTIASGSFEAGHQTVTWDGTDEAGRAAGPGIYFLRARSAGEDVTLKVVVMQ
jgi:hypothetical protein